MNQNIEKIYLLVDDENIIEGILIKYRKKDKIKYYAEEISTKSKNEKADFNEAIVNILFNSKYNKKTEFVYCDDEQYRDISNLIDEYQNANFERKSISFLGIFFSIIGLLARKPSFGGIFFSLESLLFTNKSIKMMGATERKKSLKIFYTVLLGINLVSASVNGYNKLTQTQLEKDIESFKDSKDTIDNPFDSKKDYSDEEKIELLMYAIKENPYLKSEDKYILFKLRDFFEQNPYIDFKDVYERLISLGIIYTEEKNEEVDATYFHKDNYIIDYDYHNESYQLTLWKTKHELEIGDLILGSIGSLEEYEGLNMGMTRLLALEYLDYTTPNGGYGNIMLARLMTEIVGKDKMLAAYMTNNFDIIKKELKRINDSEEDFNRLSSILKKGYRYNYGNDTLDEELMEIRSVFLSYVNELEVEKHSDFLHNMQVVNNYIADIWDKPTIYYNTLDNPQYRITYNRSN